MKNKNFLVLLFSLFLVTLTVTGCQFDIGDLELPDFIEEIIGNGSVDDGNTDDNQTNVEEHAHDFAGEWKTDGTHHWHECSCGEIDTKATHSGGEATTTEKAKCEICGASYGELKAPDHVHEATDEWKYDATYHWHECLCGAPYEKVAHSGGEATTTQKAICEECGQEYGELLRPDNIDYNVRLEGEDGIIAGSQLSVFEGPNASNGQFAAGIDNCGQGLYFIHYAPVGGIHEIEVGYFTAYPNSKHELVVNGLAHTLVYTENTGWGQEAYVVGKVTVEAELKQGYNIITLTKQGLPSDSPEYGGWAQVDYIEIKGTQQEFDKEALVYNLEQIKVEAEMGEFSSGAACPVGIDGASNGYVVGEINSVGHGSTFTLNMPAAGRYALQIAYGKDAGTRPITVSLNGTSYDCSLADYANQSWNNFHLSDAIIVLDLVEGQNVLSIARAENSNWFCFDYIVLTKVKTIADTRIEAEDCVIDGTKVKTAENAAASNGSMACDMNDCGQGLHFVYYTPVAGEYTMEIGYYTGAANSKQDLYVNGVKQCTVVYENANGWADGVSPAAIKTITITLKAGYNNITIIKNGNASDSPEYGGWVQLDYFDIKGGQEYNPNAAVDNSLNIRIEAELGNYHSGAACPVFVDGAANGFIVGDINATGDGTDMKIRVPESGTYELHIVYGKDAGARPVVITLNGTTYSYSLEDYDGQSWNVFHTSAAAATFTLEAGQVYDLSVVRADGSNWFCFDSIILVKVA